MRNPSPTAKPPRANILLVDDHKLGLAARRSLLEELGHTVVTASNGQAALELAAAQTFDLVITDWKMPKLDGLELIRRLREQHFVSPIILISGFADVVGLEESKTGADIIVQKSSSEVTQLLSAVKRLLTRKPSRKMPSSQATAKVPRPKSKSS